MHQLHRKENRKLENIHDRTCFVCGKSHASAEGDPKLLIFFLSFKQNHFRSALQKRGKHKASIFKNFRHFI